MRKRTGGFTLIELLIVMTIIGILASIAVPSYQRSVIRSREAVLAEDLYQMRQAIDSFYADNARYPESLEELQEKKYLRGIPRDPFTNSGETWYIIAPEPTEEGTPIPGRVFDVRSGSDLVGLNGVPYKEW
ncbi:MAG: prepilin-type N-terminal cleavage/methylation domain-containing protein [Syntrophotaleaceae bacterium]